MNKIAISFLFLAMTTKVFGFYMPNQGRWLSRDPIEETGGENLYAYCANVPITRTDNLGLFILPIMPVPTPVPTTPHLDLASSLGRADRQISSGIFRTTSRWDRMITAMRGAFRTLTPDHVVATSGDVSWSWFFNTLSWNTGHDASSKEVDAMHELTHAYRDISGRMAVLNLRMEEGIAYSVTPFYYGGQYFVSMETLLSRLIAGSGTCGGYKDALATRWATSWKVVNYRSSQGRVHRPWPFPGYDFYLNDDDWTLFENTYEVKVSCKELALKYNQQLQTQGCCYRFVCSRNALNANELPVQISLPLPLQ